MAAVAYFWGSSNPQLALVGFFVALIAFSLTDGVSGVPWTDMVAKTIPSNRRGRLFGTMQFLGGFGAFASGFLIRQILASDRISFPANYALLMVIGFGLLCVSFGGTMSVREKPGVTRQGASLADYFRRLPAVWRQNPAFQQMMYVRMLFSFLYLSLPFYVVFARQTLNLPESIIGIFISAQMAGNITGGLLWGYLGDNHGHRLVVRLIGVAAGSTPLLALVASLLHWLGLTQLAIIPYLLLFATVGATLSGMWMGFTNYMLDTVQDLDRPTYVGLMNTLIAPFTFLPMLGGVLVQLLSHEVLFVVTAAFIIIGNIYARRLPEPRHQSKQANESAS
jgi:hypothetical protein